MAKTRYLPPVGKAIWHSKLVDDLIGETTAAGGWVSQRYSSEKLRAYLGKWWRVVKARATEEGLALTDEEVFRHFRVSYLRLLSSGRRRNELESRTGLAVDRIKKDRLLAKAGVNPRSQERDARAWRQRTVGVIEQRLSLWETRLRAAIPEVRERDIYRFFRQRYLHVPLERFEQVEIEKGIKNTRNHLEKRAALEWLSIVRGHPQYERWTRMEFWEFKRKRDKLCRALRACKRLSLKFPPKSGVNSRGYNKYLNAYPRLARLTIHEEMLYKLILYFDGVTYGQLERLKQRHLSSGEWRGVSLDKSLNHLTSLKLLGTTDWDENVRDRYFVGRGQYLKQKVKACREGSLEFAEDVDEAELDDYLRWVAEHGEDGIGTAERLLLKLISHYGLVSHRELSNIYRRYLSRNGGRSIWSKSTARTYLTRLVDFELVEVVGRSGRVVERPDLSKMQDELRYRIHRGFLLN